MFHFLKSLKDQKNPLFRRKKKERGATKKNQPSEIPDIYYEFILNCS